jgi:segregation and condensation protein B
MKTMPTIWKEVPSVEQNDLQRTIMAILFAAGEPVSAARISAALEVDVDEVHAETHRLMDALSFNRSGIRIVQLEDAYQMCSSGEMSDAVTKVLETRKPPKLSASQLETLSVIAYYQPATRAYVDQIRGVDSAYSVSALLSKKLIEECGRLNVPGRPILYKTTPDFLRTFGLQSLEDLPEIELMNFGAAKQMTLEQLQQSAAEEPS